MEPATYGFIGTLFGAIVGASASVVTTFVNSWNSARLQAKADNLQRVERARSFQRETLLKLQESLQDAMRNTGETHHFDVLAFRKTGAWRKSHLAEELNQRTLSVNRELSILTERVSNDELREHVKLFRRTLTVYEFSCSESDGDIKINQATSDFYPIMEHIGKVLRENY